MWQALNRFVKTCASVARIARAVTVVCAAGALGRYAVLACCALLQVARAVIHVVAVFARRTRGPAAVLAALRVPRGHAVLARIARFHALRRFSGFARAQFTLTSMTVIASTATYTNWCSRSAIAHLEFSITVEVRRLLF